MTPETPPRPDAESAPDPLKRAWQRTIADAESMAETYESSGWNTRVVLSGHVAPEPPGTGSEDPELVFIVPGEDATSLSEQVAKGDVQTVRANRQEIDNWAFFVLELLMPSVGRAVLVAGSCEIRLEKPLVEAATNAGVVFSTFRTLDGDVALQLKHDDPGALFPDETESPDRALDSQSPDTGESQEPELSDDNR